MRDTTRPPMVCVSSNVIASPTGLSLIGRIVDVTGSVGLRARGPAPRFQVRIFPVGSWVNSSGSGPDGKVAAISYVLVSII